LSRGINNTPFHQHQQDDTYDDYRVPILGLLAMLLRKKSNYTLTVEAEMPNLLENLSKALTTGKVEVIAKHIFALLIAIWTIKWPSTIGRLLVDPTICYLALSMLERDRSFKHPRYTTGIIAKDEYCLRLLFALKIRLNSIKYPDISIEEHAKALEPWHTEKMESTFNSLRSLTHRASSIVYNSMSLPRIWWTDRDTYKSMLYKGDLVTIDDIKKCFNDMEKEAITLWETKVLCGTKLHIKYGYLADDLSNKEVGYSFLTDPRNKCLQGHSMSLATAILANPDLRKQFIVGHNAETGKPEWNKIELRKWLYHYAQFEEIQLSRLEMTGGAPGRVTELSGMNLCNTQTRHERNLCMLWPYVSALRMYHKSGNLTGQDKLIPHAFDGLSSDLIIQDQVLARPFAILAVMICFPDQPDKWRLYRERLFVNNGKEFATRNITDCMVRFTRPVIGTGLGVNAWRHISKAFKKKLCNRVMEVLEEGEEEDVDDAQAGRTRSTGNRVYGVSHDTLSGVAEDVLPLFLDHSTDWQKTLEVVPGGLCLEYKEAGGEQFSELLSQGVIKLPRGGRGKHEEFDIEKMVEKLKSELLHDLLEALKKPTSSNAECCQ
jgi:hypothetical protein